LSQNASKGFELDLGSEILKGENWVLCGNMKKKEPQAIERSKKAFGT